ncbi:exodeoxyribonuclease V subunit beta [Pseudoalteromonas tunicata]|uniref:exodeoxyribonuclease V subunit beta n=1 Tax=Pseudoalteromonas tunicata TaxID=314281 RepID=UPI00273EFD6F|nr:exodeoxyribonuclease V subunit beta [Pseudoalteromonas tunicata]MDP4983001.1 exodeoxyribonuclease V subunit beta [Pseudoalteromonas tunicata]
MQGLNPITMPLKGVSLIEASAGTGKTYTITALYLRHLLGLQVAGQTGVPLTVEQILVVTFTEAATAEIKDRVRKRIILARDALMGGDCDDAVVQAILSEVSETKMAFALLDAAAKSMDDAAIFTIHGFCQRMLKQHAFESGVAFNLTFIMDQSELLTEALKDYWRTFVYGLTKERTAHVLAYFPAPERLYKKVAALLSRSGAKIQPQINLDEVWQWQEQYLSLLARFKIDYLKSDFAAAILNSDLKKTKPAAKAPNLELLLAFCQSEQTVFEFGSDKKSFEIWAADNFLDPEMYKKGGKTFSHPLCQVFTELSDLQQKLTFGMPIAIAQQATKWVSAALSTKKQEQRLISPDDLLTQLHHALFSDGGDTLASQIAADFPVAMIDEFQDTDPIQYGIFSQIFNRESCAFTMIGDPKQAIYGFRGADIFTYINAKHQVSTEQQYTLGKNWRSSTGIVNSVNALFNHHDNSFIFNQDIPFLAVEAQGKTAEQALYLDGKAVTAFEFCVLEHDAPVTSKAYAMPRLAAHFSDKIATLLQQAQAGRATIGSHAVQAADICVLVRDRNEASFIKDALSKQGIASVYLSRDGVLQSPLALHLLNFLTALHGQYDESAYRGVLAGPLFNLNYQQIYQLAENEQTWQQYLALFSELSDIWYKKGAMAMLELLLMRNNLAGLWQAMGLPVERWLTDFRHLAEILQQKQLELEGSLRLVRWFAQNIIDTSKESAQLRLESDAKLVKIVTMHASKGLEYPLVFMPFAVGFREASEQIYHQDGELVYNLIKDDASQQLAEKERLAEDLRLLYVALTRPVHQCFIGMYNIAVGNSKSMTIQRTALGHLLFAGQTLTSAADWHQLLNAFAAAHSADMAVSYFAETDSKTSLSDELTVPNYERKLFTGKIERNWRLTSFSALSYNQASEHITPGFEDESHELDWLGEEQSNELNQFSFPRGARAGSCLHAIFEEIDFQHPDTHPSDPSKNLGAVVEQQLQKYSIEPHWQPVAEQWIKRVLSTPLDADGLSLNKLGAQQCLIEMEFYLPFERLDATGINQVLDSVASESVFKHNLKFETIQGMLKGFIDLIFEWQGKYYVLDYKSNHLGELASDYQQSNMEEVMQSHHYHLQYLLYSVALHRLLKTRLADYDIEQHLGGVYYLFLRGMGEGEGIYFKKIAKEIILQLDRMFEQATLEVTY